MASSATVTKSGTRKLSEVARHVVKPEGIITTGWRDIEATCTKLGTGFDEWQRGAGRLMFSKTADGKYAATVGGVGMSLPRQVGKTHLVGYAMFALCILNPGLTVIWTAHHSKTANETLLAMQGMSRRERIAPYVRRVTTGNGDEAVWFHNRSRILFGAREHGFGRGFAGIDVLVFDEAQKLPEKALDAMLATMNTAPNGLALFMGTPPTPLDQSEAFHRMRTEALSGEADDLVWIECGADPDADPDDRKQWAKANPSYPHRTPLTSMLRLRKKLAPESWMREGLGIWDEDALDPFASAWPAGLTEDAPAVPPSSIGVACSVELTHSAIVGAVEHEGRVWVRVLQYGPGTQWVAEVASRLADEFEATVVVDGGGPAKVLVPTLERACGDLRVLTTEDIKDACADVLLTVTDERLSHRGDAELDAAVRGAVRRPLGDRWAWGRRKSTRDVSALEAATLAAWDAMHSDSGPNIFLTQRPERRTLVSGPLAERYAAAAFSESDDVEVIPDMKPWERDRYRIKHDARVIIAAPPGGVPLSKYGSEELVIVGGEP
jgi:hypothetical protein